MRGILSIRLPLESIKKRTNANLNDTLKLYSILGSIFFAIIATVIIKLRQQSSLLQIRVKERTQDLNDEIREKQSALIALSQTEERNLLLLNSVGEGIYGIDLNGKTTFINPAACRLLGYQKDEMIGKFINEIILKHSNGSHNNRCNVMS